MRAIERNRRYRQKLLKEQLKDAIAPRRKFVDRTHKAIHARFRDLEKINDRLIVLDLDPTDSEILDRKYRKAERLFFRLEKFIEERGADIIWDGGGPAGDLSCPTAYEYKGNCYVLRR